MAEITFKAENGETLIARDDVQALAFRQAGLTEVKETTTKKAAEKAE